MLLLRLLLLPCRSVSVVPPAYYAQLAASRGRLIASGRELLASEAAPDDLAGSLTSEVGMDFDLRVNAKLGGSMYYI